MKLVLAISMIAVLVTSPMIVLAQEFVTKDGKITVDTVEGKDYIEVKTRNDIVYRVYPCGQLEKKTWSMLNRNEDLATGVTINRWDGSGYYTYDGSIIRYISN